ncbi:MAG TPA: hypothetical protein VGF67_30155 [Ktedonobacteraceae bacterium]
MLLAYAIDRIPATAGNRSACGMPTGAGIAILQTEQADKCSGCAGQDLPQALARCPGRRATLAKRSPAVGRRQSASLLYPGIRPGRRQRHHLRRARQILFRLHPQRTALPVHARPGGQPCLFDAQEPLKRASNLLTGPCPCRKIPGKKREVQLPGRPETSERIG